MNYKNFILLTIVALGISITCYICKPQYQTIKVRKADKEAIINILNSSADCWNKMDFEGYMASYWKSDSLKFVSGTKGINYGWDNTLENYKKAYPSKEYSGTLHFEFDKFEYLGSRKHLLLIGSYHLEREKGDTMGYFTLIWQKIEGQWVITTDFTY